MEEIPDAAGRQAVLWSALPHEWTILWSTGWLGITISDDNGTAVEKLLAYIRARRDPLLDRKLLHCRDQEEGEIIDQYVAALIRIDLTCAYNIRNTVRTLLVVCLPCLRTIHLLMTAVIAAHQTNHLPAAACNTTLLAFISGPMSGQQPSIQKNQR